MIVLDLLRDYPLKLGIGLHPSRLEVVRSSINQTAPKRQKLDRNKASCFSLGRPLKSLIATLSAVMLGKACLAQPSSEADLASTSYFQKTHKPRCKDESCLLGE